MTIHEMQEKYNKRMALRADKSKNIKIFSIENHGIIYDPESSCKNRAIKNYGSRRGITVGKQLKIGRE